MEGVMKTLIVYFSYSGNTKKIVDGIEKKFPFDVVCVEREKPYSKDYDECAYKEAKEEWEKRLKPRIKPLDVDFSRYERILLFFPIWWYTYPMPIATFIRELKGYQGQVVVFANSYSNIPSYMDNVMKDLKDIDKDIHFERGLFNKSIQEHIAYLERNN